MTIDERLEALTHTVELLASFHKDNELRMDQLTGSMGQLTKGMGQLTRNMGQLTETMTRLSNIIIAHEQRIEDLENR